MAKVAAKLFRDLTNAVKAVDDLRAKGFKEEGIGILLRDKEKAAKFTALGSTSEVMLPEAGASLGSGPLAKAGADALTDLLGLPEETVSYYDFAVAMGGILVSVHTDDTQLPRAQEILRGADALAAVPVREGTWASSPGFAQAGRMTATDPIDAKMTGDFRMY